MLEHDVPTKDVSTMVSFSWDDKSISEVGGDVLLCAPDEPFVIESNERLLRCNNE